MQFKINTIKSRLLIAFLFFTFIIVFLAAGSFFALNRAENIRDTKERFDRIHIYTLHLIKLDADFLGIETTNQDFYRTGNSNLLNERMELAEKIAKELNALQQNESFTYFKVTEEVKRFIDLFEVYDGKFTYIVQRLLKRGFKDYGMEGEMRDYAHKLEDMKGELELADLLTLRRHEKDYLIRGERIYIDKFNRLANALRTQLTAKGSHTTEQVVLLEGYQRSFNKLVELKKEIGLAYQTGLKGELDILGDHLSDSFDVLNNKAILREQELIANAKISYLWLVLLCVLVSLVLSYILSKKFTEPITRLSRRMDEVRAKNFAISSTVEHWRGSEEVMTLNRSFEDMLKRIQEQISLIDEKSKVLAEQNEHLKTINRKLHASETSLRESNQVKDKFFSIIAHDLKGPIATLTAFLEIIIKYEKGFTVEEMQQLAQQMYSGVTQLSTLLENLLEWSRSQMGNIRFQPKDFLINSLIRKNIDLLYSKAQTKDIEVLSEVEEELKVTADMNMVDFIIRNLLSNALKYTQNGGVVRVISETYEKYAVIKVMDNGVGISQEDQEKLFRTEYHLTRKGTANETGTGLGLLLSKEFIEKNAGKIWVESAQGHGTTFTFTLPLAEKLLLAH